MGAREEGMRGRVRGNLGQEERAVDTLWAGMTGQGTDVDRCEEELRKSLPDKARIICRRRPGKTASKSLLTCIARLHDDGLKSASRSPASTATLLILACGMNCYNKFSCTRHVGGRNTILQSVRECLCLCAGRGRWSMENWKHWGQVIKWMWRLF